MATITFTLDDKAAQAALSRLAAAAEGSAPVMRKVALAMKQEAYNAFRFQQSPGGGAWPALASATLSGRRRRGNASLQPLIDTGKMYASIEAENTDSEASISIGGGLPDARAWYNQFGTLHAGGHTPPRRMLPITETAANPTDAWLEKARAPIREALEAAAA